MAEVLMNLIYHHKITQMKKLTMLIAAAIFFSACQKNMEKEESFKDNLNTEGKVILPAAKNSSASATREERYNTFYGPVVQFGEGRVRSWVNISHDEKPLAIGIEFTDGVLQQNNGHKGPDHGHEALLHLHQKAKALTPFDHLTMGYMVAGHPPPGIYTVPHFDFHFYKMSIAERMAIPAFSQAMAAFNNNPPAAYLPPAYVKAPGGEAKMGAHWMDVRSPEFNGQPFTHTFIYGSYDGKVNFLEPMVSLAFLAGGTTVQKAFRQPQMFDPVNTYYPTQYNIWKDESTGRHYISLDQMVWR